MPEPRDTQDAKPSLAQSDPPPTSGRSGPPVLLVAVIVAVVVAMVVLHLTGVFGPGSH